MNYSYPELGYIVTIEEILPLKKQDNIVVVASAHTLAFSIDKRGAPLQLLEIGSNIQCSMGLYLEQYGG